MLSLRTPVTRSGCKRTREQAEKSNGRTVSESMGCRVLQAQRRHGRSLPPDAIVSNGDGGRRAALSNHAARNGTLLGIGQLMALYGVLYWLTCRLLTEATLLWW
jgi:hypothetical protein